jgi:hypothetical protein
VREVDCQVAQVLGEFACLLHQSCAFFFSWRFPFNTYLVDPRP